MQDEHHKPEDFSEKASLAATPRWGRVLPGGLADLASLQDCLALALPDGSISLVHAASGSYLRSAEVISGDGHQAAFMTKLKPTFAFPGNIWLVTALKPIVRGTYLTCIPLCPLHSCPVLTVGQMCCP